MIAMSIGVQVTFWIVAPCCVALGLGMVLLRRMVHSALCLAGLMIGLGVLYASLDAPFLFVAQIIVYTGSVMMVFVFAMMLIGIDNAEDLREMLKGHIVLAVVAAVGVAALLIGAIGHGFVGAPTGVDGVNDANGGNAQSLAVLLFSHYVLAFEATAALVITAALGAMVLAHRERLGPRRTQREHAAEQMKAYAVAGVHPGPRPGPGVYARHNSVDYPALLPDGSVAPTSVSAALDERGQSVLDPQQLARPVIEAHNEIVAARAEVTGHEEIPAQPLIPAAPIRRSTPALPAPDDETVDPQTADPEPAADDKPSEGDAR